LDIPGSPEDNLCIKAYHLIKSKFGSHTPPQSGTYRGRISRRLI
jgi:hypothetical protein